MNHFLRHFKKAALEIWGDFKGSIRSQVCVGYHDILDRWCRSNHINCICLPHIKLSSCCCSRYLPCLMHHQISCARVTFLWASTDVFWDLSILFSRVLMLSFANSLICLLLYCPLYFSVVPFLIAHCSAFTATVIWSLSLSAVPLQLHQSRTCRRTHTKQFRAHRVKTKTALW